MIRFFKKLFECRHKNAIINSNEGYCPDCGRYVRKSYYVIRCKCCGVKRVAKRALGEIEPAEKYCSNCGSDEFYTEKYEKLNVVDIYYALEVKEISTEFAETENIEIWIENDEKKGEDCNAEYNERYNVAPLPMIEGRKVRYLTG